MTKEQFKYIWNTKIKANGPWRLGALKENTARLYRDKLSKYDKDVLSKAVDKLLVDETGYLPTVGKFIEYCRWVLGEIPNPKPRNLCPCCRNTKWIYLKERDASVPCDCNKASNIPTISQREEENKKCEIGDCSPGGVTFEHTKKLKLGECPKGPKHYEKYLKKSMEREELPF